jgi:hypothetical protein
VRGCRGEDRVGAEILGAAAAVVPAFIVLLVWLVGGCWVEGLEEWDVLSAWYTWLDGGSVAWLEVIHG